jgi:methionyl-tRNA synthetase
MMNTWYMHGGLEHMFSPFPFFIGLPILAVFAVWTVAIKGYALWHAARNEQKTWFVFLLIVNSVGILELVYLMWFRADKRVQGTVAPAPAPAPKSASETEA